jgi:hypothetical protein
MKPLIIAACVGLTAAVAAAQFGPANRLLDDIYPRDATKAAALRLCILANPEFNRLDKAARDACYHHAFGDSSAPSADLKPASQIDLKQSAAMGNHIARNDIRLAQQSDRSP